MKAKAYIESKYKKMDNEERERKEGKNFISIIGCFSVGHAHKEDEHAQLE